MVCIYIDRRYENYMKRNIKKLEVGRGKRIGELSLGGEIK